MRLQNTLSLPRALGLFSRSSPLMFGAGSLGDSAATRYLYPGYSSDLAEVSDDNELPLTRDCSLEDLHILHSELGGDGTLLTYTVMLNDAPTSLAVGLGANASSGANTTTSVPALAGDRVSIRVTKAGAVVSPKNVKATMETR